MNKYPTVVLKEKRDVPVRAGHPWIFSNGIKSSQSSSPGEIVKIISSSGEELGLGIFNPNTSIAVRMLTKDSKTKIDADFFISRFKALEKTKKEFLPLNTNGFRIVNSDADYMPGLIVDCYDSTLVFQMHTFGMDLLKGKMVEALKAAFNPTSIVERSDVDVREIEGLEDFPVMIHHGAVDRTVEFLEDGIKFLADVMNGHKTGFYLDQRKARIKAAMLSREKNVLNLFGYTGAFSAHAAKGGAISVDTVDVSRPAIELAKMNMRLNGFEDEDRYRFYNADVFHFLNGDDCRNRDYDVIICDPPAFAKSRHHVKEALKAYTALNKRCFDLLSDGGILITSSCSGMVSYDDFVNSIKFAAGYAGKDAQIIDVLSQPFDHTRRLSFPEGSYLKTLILRIYSRI